MTANLLSTAPPYVQWFAKNGDFRPDEEVVGFFTETVPDGPGRVKPGLWVVVTTQGLYYLDTDTELCVRARMVHPFIIPKENKS